MKTHAFNFSDRVRYFLWHKATDRKEKILEPRNWEDDDKMMSRDKTFLGIKRKTSDKLFFTQGKKYINGEFIKGGFDFINDIRDIGHNEELTIIREERNNTTDVWEEAYRSDLDLLEDEEENTIEGDFTCSLKSSDAGLDSILKARKSESMEITRRFTIDDKNEENQLPEINTSLVDLPGRAIKSISKQTGLNQVITLRNENIGINTAYRVPATPITDLNYSSLEEFSAVIDNEVHIDASHPSQIETFEEGNMFFSNSKGYSSSRLNLKFTSSIRIIDAGYIRVWLSKMYFDNSINKLTHSGSTILFETPTNAAEVHNNTIDINLDVPQGMYLALNIDHGSSTSGSQNVEILQWDIGITLTDIQTATTTKAYTLRTAIERYLHLIVGRAIEVRSDFLDTIGKNFLITDGGLVRQIPTSNPSNDPNIRTHQLETSLKDIFDSFDAAWNLSMGIEREGLKESIRIEQKEYFFNNEVVIELGELTNIKRSTAKEYIYSGTNIGYEGDAKIEGYQGLYKTNGEVNRITTITKQEKVYSKKSKFQTDDFVRETARRQQYALDPTLDNKYDNTKMILDCVDGSELIFGAYQQRTILDDFDSVPQGVFDPSGITNGRWSPLAMTLRHGNWIRAGLNKYKDTMLSFGSSESNTQLKATLKNDNNYSYLRGLEYSESSDIRVSDLEEPYFEPVWITGNHVVTQEIMKKLEGSTVINGKEVKNFYCKCSFINRQGEKEYGYIFDVKPNGSGSWKLLKAK